MAHCFDQSSLNALLSDEGICHCPFIVERKKMLPYSYAKKYGVLPLMEGNGVLYLAVVHSNNFEVMGEMRCFLGCSFIKEVPVSENSMNKAMEMCYLEQDKITAVMKNTDVSSPQENFMPSLEGYDLLDSESSSSVIQVLNAILIEALQRDSSDIHFEPLEKDFVIRVRVDGVLHERHRIAKDIHVSIITRIKVLAKLDIAENRLPQDGRMKLYMGEKEIDFRVSTVPTIFGERVVLRILNRNHMLFGGLSELGMREEILFSVRQQLKKNQGIFLVTGPTGSGKTTTLYGMLSELLSTEINIMTIEDPVEFKLEGLAQISVNRKICFDFAKGLRHILRQDPDVIMIGEIRDKETAEIAIQAALTGHLVLSTLHTNDAPSAVARLVDMGMEPYLLTSSFIGVLAQRLVRCICPRCKIVDSTPFDDGRKAFDVSCRGYKGIGCEHCGYSGYKGRKGIYEFMKITPKLKKQILVSADAAKLREMAIEDGMVKLRKEGTALALEGTTSFAEVMRVSRCLDDEMIS